MISPTTVAAVKERADLVAIVGEVVSLRRSGGSLVGLCPFHGEKTPSFYVHPARGYYYCHGCREHGNSVDFVMRNEGLSFPDAIRELAGRIGIGIDIEEGTPRDREEADREKREREALHTVNALAAAFFERSLWGAHADRCAPYAHEELERRGLAANPGDEGPVGAALAAFRIGYAPPSWRALTSHIEKLRIPLATAAKAGLLIEREGRCHDRFRHRLMFPILDHLGRIVGFSGRCLDTPDERHAPGYRPEEKPAKYINTPESPVYTKGQHLFGLWQGKDAIRARTSALLVEGNFDVVALHARGIGHAIAPLGTAFTEAQARLLRRFTSSVSIAFDGDKAGRKATWDARGPVRAANLDARAVVLPAGEDPDSFVRRRGEPAFEALLAKGTPLREHLLRWLLKGGTEGDFEARSKRVAAAVKLLGEESDPTTRALSKAYADQLSSTLVVGGRVPANLRDLEMAIRTAMRPKDPDALPTVEPLADPLGFEVVGAILDVPGVGARPEVAAVVALLGEELARAAGAAQNLAVDDVLAGTPEPLRSHVERRLATPTYPNEASALAAVLANGERLRGRAAGAAEEGLRRAILLAESVGEITEVDRLLEQLDALLSGGAVAEIVR